MARILSAILIYWLVAGVVTMWRARRASSRVFRDSPGGDPSVEISGHLDLRYAALVAFGPPLVFVVAFLILS